MKFLLLNTLLLSGLLAMHRDCGVDTIKALINGRPDGTADPDAVDHLRFCVENPDNMYDTLGPTFSNDRSSPNPGPRYFIISIGPPASGKGTALKEYIYPRLGIPVVGTLRPDGTKVKQRDVDAVLYHRDIDKVIMDRPEWQQKLDEGQQMSLMKFSQEYARSTPARQKKMRELVRNYRAAGNFPDDVKPSTVAATDTYNWLWTHSNAAEVTHNVLFWMYVNDIYKQGPSKHVLFEATAAADHWSATLFRLSATAARHGYIPIVVYPIVHKHQLHSRWAERAGKEFRAPDYSAKSGAFSGSVNAFRNAMRVSYAISHYPGCPVRALFVLDNTGDHVEPLTEVIAPPLQGRI